MIACKSFVGGGDGFLAYTDQSALSAVTTVAKFASQVDSTTFARPSIKLLEMPRKNQWFFCVGEPIRLMSKALDGSACVSPPGGEYVPTVGKEIDAAC